MRTPILGTVCGESVLGMLGIALLKSTRHSALLMMVVVLAAVHTCGLCVAQQASDHGGVQPVGKIEEVKDWLSLSRRGQHGGSRDHCYLQIFPTPKFIRSLRKTKQLVLSPVILVTPTESWLMRRTGFWFAKWTGEWFSTMPKLPSTKFWPTRMGGTVLTPRMI